MSIRILKQNIIDKVRNKSLEKKIKQFYHCYDGGTVLDAGVSQFDGTSSSNYFLKNFHQSELYTGLAIQNMNNLQEKYPEKKLRQYDGQYFPFKNNEFNWIFSNAVIEHTGEYKKQLLFLNEMIRVAKNVFFTTPNKYYPVELHKKILFLHYYKPLFYSLYKISEHDINLFSYKQLKKLLKDSNATDYQVIKNIFFGLPMTFTIIIRGGQEVN